MLRRGRGSVGEALEKKAEIRQEGEKYEKLYNIEQRTIVNKKKVAWTSLNPPQHPPTPSPLVSWKCLQCGINLFKSSEKVHLRLNSAYLIK